MGMGRSTWDGNGTEGVPWDGNGLERSNGDGMEIYFTHRQVQQQFTFVARIWRIQVGAIFN